MRKWILSALALTVFCAAGEAQAVDFFGLVTTGTPQQIQAAIDQGAQVNVHGPQGRTPLMIAAMWNPNPEAVSTLLKAGAEVDARSKRGRTALMIAAESSLSPEIVTMLLKAGSDAKLKDNAGKTALDYAQGNAALKGTSAHDALAAASQ